MEQDEAIIQNSHMSDEEEEKQALVSETPEKPREITMADIKSENPVTSSLDANF